jgi:hypothetical protein
MTNEQLAQHRKHLNDEMKLYFQQQLQSFNNNINSAAARLSGTLDSKLDTQNSKLDTQTKWFVGIIFTVLLGFAGLSFGYVSLLPYIETNVTTGDLQ